MDGKHTPVSFLFLMLTIAGGFRLVVTEIQPLQNVTQTVGYNIVIKCSSNSTNSTNQPSWFKYDHGKILIYNASSSGNINSSKYLVGTGNKTLTVMNAEWIDAVTYCCNFGGLDDYCANVVLIGSHKASVKPSNRVRVGDNVTLVCYLSYSAPISDPGAPFPLSDDQDPKFSMFLWASLGSRDEIFEKPVVDVATMPYWKTISFNKTVEVADLDRNLFCGEQYSGILLEIATLDIVVKYPNNESSRRSVYSINEAFECLSERFPFLNVTWTDETIDVYTSMDERIPNTPRIISTGIGNATAKILAPGKYVWRCTVTSPLKTKTIYNTDLSFRLSAGEKVTRSILLTAGCMLFLIF